MLVLISFALVLIATVLLVIGLLANDGGLGLIYVSIACSVLAGVVLVVATRASRPRAAAEGAGPAPVGDDADATPDPTVATAVAERAGGAGADVDSADDDTFAPTAPVAVVEDDADFFPIADYDDLKVSEIMPLLPELYPEELDVVEQRERTGRGRVTILNRLAELRDELATTPAAESAGEWGVSEDDWTAESFPIAGYESLTVAQIKAQLDHLTDEELDEVRAHEVAGANRKGVIKAIDDMFEPEEPPAPPAKKAAAAKAPAKTAAKKATAKKAGAKKATGTKSAAKKATAKKATGAKKTAKKATGKKAAGRKAAAKRS